MDTLLVMNRIMGRFKSILKNEEVDLTFNETLAIEAIKRKRCTKNNVKEILLKDKSYISRLVDNLFSRGILEKSGNEYLLTRQGEEVYERTSEIYSFIREEYKKEISDEELDVIIKSLNNIEEALKTY